MACAGCPFVAEPGTTVALVGASGAGKSTALALIPRLHDVTAGRITLDGADVREVTLASLRDAIAYVGQDTLLFDDTVGANIALGRPGATQAEIADAAEAAAAGFIEALPEGFAMPVGTGGQRLSGGQRQRVALARALLRDPRILLLDEATSALDAESEAAVQQALIRLRAWPHHRRRRPSPVHRAGRGPGRRDGRRRGDGAGHARGTDGHGWAVCPVSTHASLCGLGCFMR